MSFKEKCLRKSKMTKIIRLRNFLTKIGKHLQKHSRIAMVSLDLNSYLKNFYGKRFMTIPRSKMIQTKFMRIEIPSQPECSDQQFVTITHKLMNDLELFLVMYNQGPIRMTINMI